MFRNECLFLEGTLGDPEKRMVLSEKATIILETETSREFYDMYYSGGLIVFEFKGAQSRPPKGIKDGTVTAESKPKDEPGVEEGMNSMAGTSEAKPKKKTTTKRKPGPKPKK